MRRVGRWRILAWLPLTEASLLVLEVPAKVWKRAARTEGTKQLCAWVSDKVLCTSEVVASE